MGNNHTVRYNIVTDDGEPSSVTVFLAGGGQLVATADHRNFDRIVSTLKGSTSPTERQVRGLFDVSVGIQEKMITLTERVTIARGKVYLDHDLLAGPLVNAILRFYGADVDDWKPLVAFLEKVMQNPNEHSRVQLFRWLEKHHYAIAEDGDFIAYKGIKPDGKSDRSGAAYVNGVLVNGRIPNKTGTIIEMPRNSVEFQPGVACSTGLHVGNWGYASTFIAGGTVVRCKVNPRDVVSVPTDADDAKVRVCRYRVLDVVTKEDRSLLFAGDYRTAKVRPEPAKRPAKKLVTGPKPATKNVSKRARKAAAAPAKPSWPAAYEQFRKADFVRLADQKDGFKEMRWLAKEWEVTVPSPRSKVQYIEALNKEAQARTRRFKQASA